MDFDRPLHLSDDWHLSLYPNLGVATQPPQLPHDRIAETEEAPQSSVLSGWLKLGVASTRARLPLDQVNEADRLCPVCMVGIGVAAQLSHLPPVRGDLPLRYLWCIHKSVDEKHCGFDRSSHLRIIEWNLSL